jgi:hypothetical protein
MHSIIANDYLDNDYLQTRIYNINIIMLYIIISKYYKFLILRNYSEALTK